MDRKRIYVQDSVEDTVLAFKEQPSSKILLKQYKLVLCSKHIYKLARISFYFTPNCMY